MTDSPVIHADIGDGKRRRFFLGADELRQIQREAGRGYYTLYVQFAQNAEPHEVAAILRLALIGGGCVPQEAAEIVEYYAAPPRPLRRAYMLAFDCLAAAWNGTETSKSGSRLTPSEMDAYFVELEASLLKANMDPDVIKGKSFAEVQAIMRAMSADKEAPAPDADTFNAIKSAAKKGAGK